MTNPLMQDLYNFRSSHQRCSIEKGVLENFKNFTGKQLCQSLFFNEVAGLRKKNTFFKNTSEQLLLYLENLLKVLIRFENTNNSSANVSATATVLYIMNLLEGPSLENVLPLSKILLKKHVPWLQCFEVICYCTLRIFKVPCYF